MQIVNFDLIKQPLNWLIVILMLVIAAVAGHLILSAFGQEPATPTTNN